LQVYWQLANLAKNLAVFPNELWCESTTNPAPVLRIAASRGFSELTKSVIRLSHGHSTPSLKISCKSVQPFSRNLADKETDKQTNKEMDKKQCPVPLSGRGKNGQILYLLEPELKSVTYNAVCN